MLPDPFPGRGDLLRRLYARAGPTAREKAMRNLEISAARFSNILRELDDPRTRLPEGRAAALTDPLSPALPPHELRLIQDLLTGAPLQDDPGGELPEWWEWWALLGSRCRQAPFLRVSTDPPLPGWILQQNEWLTRSVRMLASLRTPAWASSQEALDHVEGLLHLAHLSERAGLWASMWLSLSLAESQLNRIVERRPPRSFHIRYARLRLELFSTWAVWAYNLDDRQTAASAAISAFGYFQHCRDAGLLPEDAAHLEARLIVNLVHYSDSPREAVQLLERLRHGGGAEKPLLQAYGIHGVVAVHLRHRARPRDPRGLLDPLMEAMRDPSLPPNLRASCGRRAAEACRAWVDRDRAEELFRETLEICREHGLLSQEVKLRDAWGPGFRKAAKIGPDFRTPVHTPSAKAA